MSGNAVDDKIVRPIVDFCALRGLQEEEKKRMLGTGRIYTSEASE